MGITTTGHLVFLAVDDLAAARTFYEGTLGLRFAGEEPGALVFDLGGTPLRISAVDGFTPQTFTVLGWNVADLDSATAQLSAAGVEPLRYDGMPHDAQGIASLGPLRILWFTDPAGNVLSLTQA